MEDRFFTTSDGVKLHYVVGGRGDPLILLPGFGQSTETFAPNYGELMAHFTVIGLDYRAHGQSEVPAAGWHIERLAKDLEELLELLKVEQFFVVAHSMGNTVAWCFMELFGQKQIKGYILEDEAPCLLAAPEWDNEEKAAYIGKFQIPDQWSFGVRPPWDQSKDPLTPAEYFRLQLLREHLCRDWRDMVLSIRIPTLILMGEASHFGEIRLWHWLKEAVKDSRLEVFSKEEGGVHEIHGANPKKYNQLVIDFLEDIIKNGK